MNNEPMVLDYRALITPKGVIAIVVRNPRLIASTALVSTGKTWAELLALGWRSKPVKVELITDTTELANATE